MLYRVRYDIDFNLSPRTFNQLEGIQNFGLLLRNLQLNALHRTFPMQQTNLPSTNKIDTSATTFQLYFRLGIIILPLEFLRKSAHFTSGPFHFDQLCTHRHPKISGSPILLWTLVIRRNVTLFQFHTNQLLDEKYPRIV
jgi:hypothetical protein